MTSKRKSVTLSIKEKIKSLEAGYTVPYQKNTKWENQRTIFDIRKNKKMILSYATTSSSPINKWKTFKVSARPEVDKAVYTRFLQERSRGKKMIDYVVLIVEHDAKWF